MRHGPTEKAPSEEILEKGLATEKRSAKGKAKEAQSVPNELKFRAKSKSSPTHFLSSKFLKEKSLWLGQFKSPKA